MEPRAAHAAWDAASERVTLTCATQMPHAMRTIIADLIGMPESDLRVIAPDVGGGFGQKMSLAPEFVVVTWLARKLRTSVAWVEDRRENLVACFHSRDQSVSLEGAFDADARLIGLAADIVADVGAYSCYPTTCGVEPLMAMAEMPGPYDVREYACVSRGVVTNTCPMAPYRGVSRPVITFTLERLMDKAAAAFGLDPVEIRRRNLVKTFPYTSATGLVFDEATYVETMDMAVEAVGVPAFRARQAKARAEGRYLGLGFATFSERTGYGTPAFAARGMEVTPGWETVEMTMDPSGFVEARIGASPHGQGLRTTLSQIIADELGIAPRPHQDRARRHRPHAVRMGDLCQPLAGDLPAAPPCWRRARSAPSSSRWRAFCSRRRRKTSCSKPMPPASPEPIAPFRSRRWRAPPIIKPTGSRARSAPASARPRPTIRPERSPMPVMSPWSRSISRPAGSRSRSSWWPRTPDA